MAATASASCAAEPAYRVASVAFDLRAGTTVGPKRSGSLCLPAGSIAWRDAKPDEAEARAALAEGLRAGGLTVADPGNPFGDEGTDRAIRVAVRGVRLSACVPPSGLGRVLNHSRAIRGDGVVALGWQAYARGAAGATGGGEVCAAFSYREDVGTLSRMVLVGLRTAAEQIALAVQGEAVPAADARCREIEGAALPTG